MHQGEQNGFVEGGSREKETDRQTETEQGRHQQDKARRSGLLVVGKALGQLLPLTF